MAAVGQEIERQTRLANSLFIFKQSSRNFTLVYKESFI